MIASARLRDPNFAQTVVLIVQHDAAGALGLVLNRPLETTVQEACSELLDHSVEADGVLHQGGPCEGLLMVVHTQSDIGEVEILPGVFFTADRTKIEWLLANVGSDIRYFVGYSGWGAGQLEAEVSTGSWVIEAAGKPTVFSDDPKQWSKLAARATVGRYVDPDRIPDDASLN